MEKQLNGFAIAGLVIGIISLITFCCFGGFLGILGIIFSIVALTKKQSTGMAITGLILSIIALLLSCIVMIFAVSSGDYLNELNSIISGETRTTQSSYLDENDYTTEETTNDTTDTDLYSPDTKRVGDDYYGYVSIPENWVTFIDIGLNYEETDELKYPMQWSYADVNIITLNYLPASYDPKDAASAIALKNESDGMEDMITATVTLIGETAYQVYGYYPNENLYLVAWVFSGSDGVTHIISAEGLPDSVADVVEIIENTYSLYE